MSKFPSLIAVALLVTAVSDPALAGEFNLGREATPAEVTAWDIDVRPDGQGLPDGKGTVAKGEEIFAEQCAVCHGDFAEGVDRWPVLAGGQGSLKGENPEKTIGSYWPYLSTMFDYVNRAMPFGDAQSLQPDEIYAITAFVLHMNDIVDAEFELSKENFTSIKLPNETNFIDDPRPDTPTLADGQPCMKNCKDKVEITMRARILDVTPSQDENPSASVD